MIVMKLKSTAKLEINTNQTLDNPKIFIMIYIVLFWNISF